jgi:hypothetical protein
MAPYPAWTLTEVASPAQTGWEPLPQALHGRLLHSHCAPRSGTRKRVCLDGPAHPACSGQHTAPTHPEAPQVKFSVVRWRPPPPVVCKEPGMRACKLCLTSSRWLLKKTTIKTTIPHYQRQTGGHTHAVLTACVYRQPAQICNDSLALPPTPTLNPPHLRCSPPKASS